MASFLEPPSKKICLDTKFSSNEQKFDNQTCNPLKNAYSINQLKGVQLSNGKTINLKKFNQGDFKFNVNANSPSKNSNSIINNSFKNSNGKHMKNGKSSINIRKNTKDLLKHRKALPIYDVRKDLLSYLKKGDTNILIGETGSGKTTQVPQFLYEEMMLNKGSVVITQPRRVAAISMATRVAEEAGTELGEIVGYSVRFEEMISDRTKIKFATDGMLLREAMLDPLLKRYSWIILDEAHERTVNTDILFGIVKRAQKIRKEKGKSPLHILVMSATMNAQKFSSYFNDCPMLMAEGREHKLEILFTAEKSDDYIIACLSTVIKIHKQAPVTHGILVFLTGQEEIDNACLALSKIIKRCNYLAPIKISPLYSALPQHLQMEVFQPSDTEERHVIFSTNIAETSVTIPGIRYVIDSGKAKIRTYNPSSGFDILKVRQISQAQAWQRAGRAGREGPGSCYHAYTEAQYKKMPIMPAPEIHRTNLATVVLQLLTVGVKDVINFDFMDRPRQEYLLNAVEQLLSLEAAEKDSNGELRLTEEGKKMAAFPLDPKYAKILLMGPKYKCTHEVLTIVAMLSGEQVNTVPSGKMRSVATARHRKFASVEGDHMTMLKIYQTFKASKKNKQWCHENFLNYRNLIYISAVRKQLSDICYKAGLKMLSCGENTDDVRRCLLTGLFTQVAELQADRKYLTLSNHDEAQIHPSSCLFSSRSPYLMYTEIITTSNAYMHGVSWVAPEWLYQVAPDYFRKHHIKADPAHYAK
uniref:RNA helicase n=1 Tax=Hirondellea gigas TaxID=1518452 RepID=A0A2P2I525_9CRUS